MASADGPEFPLLVLSRRLLRFLRLAYVPFGPTFDPAEERGQFLSRLAACLRPYLPPLTFLLRFDLPWEKTGGSPGERSRLELRGHRLGRDRGSRPPRLRKAAGDIQPPATVLVDLRPSEAGILSAMKSKTRYNIRLAEKRGIAIREGTTADVETWYRLYQETARRDGIAIHGRSYYEGLLRQAGARASGGPVLTLLLASADGELLAGNIIAIWKGTGTYLTGASSGAKRNLMPTYALQWEAILRAKAAGCQFYDLYGVPCTPDPSHPMFGLYQFKTGFSNRIIERWGSWDAPLLPLVYSLYALAERFRLFWFRRLRKALARSSRHRRAADSY